MTRERDNLEHWDLIKKWENVFDWSQSGVKVLQSGFYYLHYPWYWLGRNPIWPIQFLTF